jgi:hypothetical protein
VLYGNFLSRTPNIEAPAKTLLEGGVGVNAKASETYEVFLPFFTVLQLSRGLGFQVFRFGI